MTKLLGGVDDDLMASHCAAMATEVAGLPRQRLGRVRLARALACVALPLPALAVALHISNSSSSVQTWWVSLTVISAGLGAMGALLATRIPDNPIGWIFLAGGIGQGLTAVGREWAVFGHVTHPGSLPGPAWGAWLGWGSTIALATLPLALLRFPDGRLTARFWLWVERVVIAATAVSVIASMAAPGAFTDDMPGLANPIGLDWSWLAAVETVAWLTLSVTVLGSAICLVLRWRGASPEMRVSLRWVTITGAALALEIFVENTPIGDAPVFVWLGPIAFLLFIGTVTLSVFRHRLWDIDVLLDLSLVYAIVTVLIGGAFVVLVATIGKAFDQRDVFWPSLVAIMVFMLAFVPLRNRIAELVDRIRRGGRTDPYRALRVIGRPGALSDPVASLREAVEVAAAESAFLDYVAVTPTDGQQVATGLARSPVFSLPLDHHGARVGTLAIAYRPGAAPTRSVPDPLAGLRTRMAAVVATVGLNQAVVESRRAVAVAREEERRRLRRDLHDGLGPALAAIAMRVDGARLLINKDPGRAGTVLAGLGDDVRTTIADVRRLVYDLQPPVLDAVGLLAAIGEQAAAFSDPATEPGTMTVELVAGRELPELPAAIEVAAYRIVCEALANVARHAGAARCRIEVAATAGSLTLTVDDDGNGRGGRERPGIGTASMIERATELGGTCSIGPAPMGGTRVAATLPLPTSVTPAASAPTPLTSAASSTAASSTAASWRAARTTPGLATASTAQLSTVLPAVAAASTPPVIPAAPAFPETRRVQA